jgi:hypothetical protein
MYWCFHCYAVNPSDSGPCVRRGRPVQAPAGLTYDDRPVRARGHPDGDRAIVAANALGQRQVRSALPTLRTVDMGDALARSRDCC